MTQSLPRGSQLSKEASSRNSSNPTSLASARDSSCVTHVLKLEKHLNPSSIPQQEEHLTDEAARQLGLEKYKKSVDAWRTSIDPVTDFERRAVDALYSLRDAVTSLNRVLNMLENSEVRNALKERNHDPDACALFVRTVKQHVDDNRRAYKKTFFGDDT